MKIGSKRRRTKQEIMDQKTETQVKAQALNDKLASFERLQQELEDAKQQAQINQESNNVVNQMIDSGYVELGMDGMIRPGKQFQDQMQA